MYLLQRKGIYYVEYFDSQKNGCRRISTKTKNRKEALSFISHLEENLSKQIKTENTMLAEFKKAYLDFIQGIRNPKHYRCIKSSFNQLQDHVGNIPLAAIKTRDLEKFLMVTFQRAKYSAALYYRNLKAAFNKAIQWEYLTSNSTKGIELPKIPKSFPLFISKEELNKILDQTKKIQLQNIFNFAFYTGMRLGEITY